VRGALIDGRTTFIPSSERTTMNPTDFLGREIRLGDLIVYPWRRGSAMGLNWLSVIEVTPDYVSGHSNLGHCVSLRNLKNIVVVQRPQTGPEN
jgi:hypothetical protein